MFAMRRSLVRRSYVLTQPRKCVQLSWRPYAVSCALVEHASAIDAFEAHGVDVERIRCRYPYALRYPPTRVLATIDALSGLKVDPVRVLRRCPRLLSTDPQSWETRLAVLCSLELDVATMLTACPELLSYGPDTLKTKLEGLVRVGLDPGKIMKAFPNALGLREDRIRGTLFFLGTMGMDGVRIVNAAPSVLSHSVELKLRPVVQFVTIDIGRAVVELNQNPTCFTFSLDGRMRPRYAFAELHAHHRSSLCALFIYPDSRFVRFVGRPLDEYHMWLATHLKP